MNDFNGSLKPFLGGLFGGVCGVLGSHPFDTIKTRIQSTNLNILESTRRIYNESGFKGFYRGIVPPTIGFGFEKLIVFGVYEFSKSFGITNDFYSGIISGIACTSVVSPYEKIKIKLQNNRNLTFRDVIKSESIRSLYNGYTPTLVREVPGYGIYFTTYTTLKKQFNTFSPFHAFLCGGLSGMSAWMFIYPSDPVKTLMQNENIRLREAVSKIYNEYGFKGFYRGFWIAMLRVIPLHSFVFLGYEMIMKL